ncbi:hypothetical protein NM208_g355 [Fusarium decemcellulare]|uniref:Uncharacterized protein n=1 Tax=Fusarium decemcellulare TaxID=57161 RepID=A0ACC1SZM0_9HYPO|nr:hypothetical protein NM208_g355 [Fusarium decemcellulare]
MSETGCLQPNSKSLEPDMACQDDSYVGIPDSGVSLGTWSLACSYQQDFSAEIGFSDVDLQLLDAFISTLPSGLYNPLPDTPEFWKSQESIETTSLSTTGKSNTDVGSPHDTLSQGYYSGGLQPLKQESERTNLASSSRNRILSALVQWGSEDIARIIEVLPSVGPLNALLQSYLTTPVAHANTFIHVATFNPNEKRADLLLAMLASSCILSSDATLNKLGRVFQECVLATLPKHFEVGSSASRDLELAQAFLITLEVGVWSGYMRTTEAAESFFQPLLTMIRRTGMLNHSSYTLKCDSGQHGMSLRERWLEWLHLESWKRLVCRVYKHDTNTSMALQVNPLISYAEFCLALPASDDMWSAASAEEWNSLFLAQQQNGSPQQVTLHDYLDDVEGIYVSEITADLSIAREVFLSFAWGLSWEYIQLDRFQSQRPSKWNLSIMNSRYNELTEILDRCYRRPNRDDLFLLNSELKMNCIRLHLHAPYHDAQIFFESREALHARTTYPSLVKWAQSEVGRKSVCYAGQLIRTARLSPEDTIRGPGAIMIYQAALILIVYGVVCTTIQEQGYQRIVQVDSCEDIGVQRFLQFGYGVPAIQGTSCLSGDSSNSTQTDQTPTYHSRGSEIAEWSHDQFSECRLMLHDFQFMNWKERAAFTLVYVINLTWL